MPCSPNQINVDPTTDPGIPIPGFGIPFSPIQIPLPSFDLPTNLIEDLVDLMSKLGALFPSGLFKANLDLNMKGVLEFIASILNQIAPFLSFYNFIIAALKLIACIIEVLCAIPNPFAVALKLKKLFMECLPPFINLLPWLALIAMIIALLLLILALIEFIILTIIKIIEDIIRNLSIFYKAIKLHDSHSILAAVQKLASLLCFLQNIMAVLVAIAAIIAVIKSLAAFAGFAFCSDDDPDGCCSPQLCPAFVKNTPNGIPVVSAKLIYRKHIGADNNVLFPGIPDALKSILPIPDIRPERWQLVDKTINPTYPVSSIIFPVVGNIFWPDPLEFKSDMQPGKAPYTADINITLDPASLGFVDTKGSRKFIIKDCIVVRKPYIGVYDYTNTLVPDFENGLFNINGTLNVEGGLVFESDGTTKYMIDGYQGTLNTFIHQPELLSTGSAPLSEDALIFDNISFTWKPNAPALAGYSLVTAGCIPEISLEKAVQNSIITAEGIAPVLEKMKDTGVAPDVETAQACVNNAINELRKNITTETVAVFSAATTACMNNLKKQTIAILLNALKVGVSQFKSTVALDTDLQFVRQNITATVYLKDPSGTILSTNLPSYAADDMKTRLIGTATFGKISDFTYDGYQAFTATISSEKPGAGQLTVAYDGKIFSTITPGTNTTPTKIDENILNYTFVGVTTEAAVRRDNTDVSGNE